MPRLYRNDETVFLYTLCEPDTEEVRYVGRSLNPNARLRSHTNDHASPCFSWNASLRSEGKRPMLRIVDEVTGDIASARELGLIVAFDSPRLLNIRDTRDKANRSLAHRAQKYAHLRSAPVQADHFLGEGI